MASKLVLTLAFLAVARAEFDEICTCNKEQIESERTAVWELTDRLKGSDDLPVLPAVIGPLVPCGNCLNYDRKKRMVFPEPAKKTEGLETGYAAGSHDRRCPKDYVRIAYMCVPSPDYLDDLA